MITSQIWLEVTILDGTENVLDLGECVTTQQVCSTQLLRCS